MQWITTMGIIFFLHIHSHSYVTIVLFAYSNTNAFWNHPGNILSAEEICFHGAGRSFNKGTDVHIRSVGTAYWENLSGNIFSGLIIYSYPYFFFAMVVFLHSKEFWKLAAKVKTNQKLRLFFIPRQTMAQFSGNYCSLKGRDSKLQPL